MNNRYAHNNQKDTEEPIYRNVFAKYCVNCPNKDKFRYKHNCPYTEEGDSPIQQAFAAFQYLVMGPAGELYVNDSSYGNNYIRTISPSGEVSTILGGAYGYVDGDSSTALLDDAGGLSVAPDGTLYYGDADNCVVRKIVH